MNGYRLAIGCALGVFFAIDPMIRSRLDGTAQTIAGYAVTLGFFLALAEFATLAIGRRVARRRGAAAEAAPVRVVPVLALASLFLMIDLCAKSLSPYLLLQFRPPRTAPLLLVVGFWLAIVWHARRRSSAARTCLIGLAGLVLGTRVLVYFASPLEHMRSDMIPTIDRALDELLAGHFPYRDFPPAMPYLPGMFLAYLPPKLAGLDVRLMNPLLDLMAAGVAMTGVPRQGSGRRPLPSVGLDQLVLPLFLLHPTWTYQSVNTQFAPSVLTTVLLARSITSARPWAQAAALGLAVGSNQMLLATAPIVFAWWLRRHGRRRAAGLAVLAAAVFLTLVAPFLLWSPREFVAVAFMGRGAFTVELLSGRFTVLPLFVPILPHAGLVLSTLAIGIGTLAAWRARRPEHAVAAMALGLCGSLLVQWVSFPHYFLPVIALAAIAAGEGQDGAGSHAGRHLSSPKAVRPALLTT